MYSDGDCHLGSTLLTGRSQEGPHTVSTARARLLWLQVGDHGHRGPGAGRVTADLGGAAQERLPGLLQTGTDTPSAGWLAGWRRRCSLKVTALGLWIVSPLASGGSELHPAPLGPAPPLGAQRSHVCLLHCPEQAPPLLPGESAVSQNLMTQASPSLEGRWTVPSRAKSSPPLTARCPRGLEVCPVVTAAWADTDPHGSLLALPGRGPTSFSSRHTWGSRGTENSSRLPEVTQTCRAHPEAAESGPKSLCALQ